MAFGLEDGSISLWQAVPQTKAPKPEIPAEQSEPAQSEAGTVQPAQPTITLELTKFLDFSVQYPFIRKSLVYSVQCDFSAVFFLQCAV